jgi:ABC-type multidrug transport system fused ATPase/permease subunit
MYGVQDPKGVHVQVLDVTGFLKFAVQMAAMFESRFNSVERLLTYHALPQEAPPQIPDKKPPPEWPQEGRLAYRDVWLRYRPELDPVLKVSLEYIGPFSLFLFMRSAITLSNMHR